MDDYERYATGLMIVFGALIVGALMAANLYMNVLLICIIFRKNTFSGRYLSEN